MGRRLIAVGAEAESDDAPAWQIVVGIVEDARYRELDRGRFDLYVPFTQVSMGLNHLVIRAASDPARLAAALRSEVQRADPNFVIDSIAPLRGLVDDVMRPWRFNMTMAAAGRLGDRIGGHRPLRHRCLRCHPEDQGDRRPAKFSMRSSAS